MRGLDSAVGPLPLRRQHQEVALGRGRHGLDHILHRIAIDPCPQVNEQDGDFGIR